MSVPNIFVTDSSSLLINVNNMGDQIADLEKHCSNLRELNNKMSSAWSSDTIDKTSYFNASESHIKALLQLAKALDLTMESLRSYVLAIEKESNN